MSIRIRLKFPEFGKLLQDFLSSLEKDSIAIPVSKTYESGTEIELNLTLPELAQEQTVRVKVLKIDPETKILSAQILHHQEVERLFEQLHKIPAYQALVKKPSPPVIKIEEEAEPEPAPLKPEPEMIKLKKEEAEFQEEGPEVEIKLKREELETPSEPAPAKAKEKKTAEEKMIRDQPQPKEKAPEPKAPETPVPKPEPKPKAEEKAQESDLISQLKGWLLIKDKDKEKKEAPEKEPEKKEEEKKKEEELDLEPASEFAQSLVKAMLRSGYYSPDHPGSAEAKVGLYNEYKKAVGDKPEIGFMLQHRVGQSPEIYLTGIVDEPIPLKKLLGPTTSELFFPKYLDYFNRKRLVSFSIKSEISKERFNKFVDIMSDPTVDKGEASESGRLLTRMLIENQINEISALFETDLIQLETDLPWRVEMAIQRLAKDLRVLPMFKDISKADLRRLKRQIIQDIQRPLRNPELLKDIILNVYLIAMQVPGIDEEELEEAIIENFPLPMLLPTSEFIFKEFTKINELKPATPEEEQIISRRIQAVKRILKKVAGRVIEKEVEGADQFLAQLFSLKILTFEELPESVQEKVNNQRMADEFQKQPNYWLGKFAEAKNKEELDLFLKYFSKILPILIERKDWQGLYLITETFLRIPQNKLKIFAELGIENPAGSLWEKQIIILVRCLLTESDATRKGLEQLLLLLGDLAMNATYQALLQETETGKRKILIETLLQFKPKAMELFRAILKDPSKSAQLHLLALDALGRAREKKDLELIQRYLKHSRAELRSEAITALVKISGWEAFPSILSLLSDPDPIVKKRVIAVLGGFASAHPEAKTKLVELALDHNLASDQRALVIIQLGRALPEEEEDRIKIQEELLALISQGEGLRGKLRRAFKGSSEELEKLKLASLDLLGKIGNQEALDKLSKLSLSSKELQSRLDTVLHQLQLRLGAK